MLTLFKGELTYDDIWNRLVYRDLIELRQARENRLEREAKTRDKLYEEEEKNAASESFKNMVMAK